MRAAILALSFLHNSMEDTGNHLMKSLILMKNSYFDEKLSF